METYSDRLKSADWLSKREEIKARDGFKCVLCGSTDSLEVHHTRYIKSRMPWEYPSESLVTLCKQHHGAIHDDTMRLKAENILLLALKNAKLNSMEILELIPVCLAHETEFSKRIHKATH